MVEEMAEPFCRPDRGSCRLPGRDADENANGLFVTFGFALVIIFLVLAAQFESFVSGLIIMSTVPLGLACAVFAMIVTGNTLNIYSQIGLVMLVGIMAKNGILIVEFANQLRDRGQDVRSAIENAANIRLRPVMMTMIRDRRGRGYRWFCKRCRRRSAHRPWLGARGWVGPGGGRNALSDARRLSGHCPLYQAACRRGAEAAGEMKAAEVLKI